MPEELNIEKNSLSATGLRLYLTLINPFIKFYGKPLDKVDVNYYTNILNLLFKSKAIKEEKDSVYSEHGVDLIFQIYPTDQIHEMLMVGEKIFKNYAKYGYSDWYEFNLENWGCKWNASETYFNEDLSMIEFQTPWTPPLNVIKELAKQHPDLEFTYKYSEEQTGYLCGKIRYKNGECIEGINYESFSPEACKLTEELWGHPKGEN